MDLRHIPFLRLLALLASLAVASPGLATPGSAYGTVNWPNGTRYEGQLQAGQPSGQGTLYWRDGALYHGSFSSGQRDGTGFLRLPDGSSHKVTYAGDRMIAGPVAAVDFERHRQAAEPRLEVDQQIAVQHALDQWVAAWSEQDVNSYLDAYHQGFEPPAGMDRAAWRQWRKARVAGPQWIRLSVENVRVRPLPQGEVEVAFVQRYSSDRYSDVVGKRLLLALDRGNWRIVEEAARTP